jgi:hypothetical protein
MQTEVGTRRQHVEQETAIDSARQESKTLFTVVVAS